jgi:hypothetical protein
MAKRKKTPDILAELLEDERVAPELQEPETDRPADRQAGEPAKQHDVQQTDPLATLFPQKGTPTLQFSSRVTLTITAPKSIKGEVESSMTQELRSLGGVVMVDEEADWVFVILGAELQTKRGDTYGVALSAVVLQAIDSRLLKEWFPAQRSPSHPSVVDVTSSHLYDFRGVWLRVGAKVHLQSLCRGVVADFNSKYLEEQRKSHQQLLENYSQAAERA